MAVAILLGVLVLVGAGLVIALRSAAAARRELEDLEGEFAEDRGSLALDSDSDPTPWSSVDLEILREDVIVVEGVDPFDTLTEAISPATWREVQESDRLDHTAAAWKESDESDSSEHAAAVWDDSEESDSLEHAAASWLASRESNGSENALDSWLASRESNGSEHTAANWWRESNGSEQTSTTDLAPVDDVAPVAWRAPGDAPIIILVVGVGFLGTGMTAGVTTAARLRRAWGQFEDSFTPARVITLDPEARPAAPSTFDPEAPRDGIIVDDEHDPLPTQENSESQVRWPPPRPNGLGPRPNGEPKPIEWRAPSDYAGRR